MVRALVVASIAWTMAAWTTAAHAGRPMCRPGAKYRGAPVDLDLQDADLQDVMRLLADAGNVNIVLAEGVRGKVTLRLRRVAWDAAACTIAAAHKLTVTIDGNVVLVTK
jgi:type II secretory pathway component HofQ